MKTWLNCVFWNILDERHPKQRGDSVEKSEKDEAAAKRRETRAEKNRIRAPNLVNAIARIAQYETIDLFLLAEYHLDQSHVGGDAALCAALERQTGRQFTRIPNNTLARGADGSVELKEQKSIAIISSLEQKTDSMIPQQLETVEPVDDPCSEEPFDESRLTLRRLYVPGEPDPLLLAGLHLVSKRNANNLDQREEARRIARRIRFVERQVFGDMPPRTVIVGDFNMNPWEEGMMLPDTFRSLEWYDFDVAKPPSSVWGKDYPYSYNPTWSLIGDGRTQPGGTYVFEDKQGHIRRRWNLYDQILLRPAVLEYWPVNISEGCLRIIHKVGRANGHQLSLTAGKMLEPDLENYSDHLPILFRLGHSN